MAELEMDREYIVPLITSDAGDTTAIHLFNHDQHGVVLWLFTSVETGRAFLNGFLGKDPTRPYMEVLEKELDREEPRYSSEDLNFGEGYAVKTLRELLPVLEGNNVDVIAVDPGQPGQWDRIYPSPHKD